jgi:hypothetical protein
VDYPASRGASFLRGARRGQEIRNMEWNSLGLAAGYFCSRASDGGGGAPRLYPRVTYAGTEMERALRYSAT